VEKSKEKTQHCPAGFNSEKLFLAPHRLKLYDQIQFCLLVSRTGLGNMKRTENIFLQTLWTLSKASNLSEGIKKADAIQCTTHRDV